MSDATEYLMTWDGMEGRIISNGYRLGTDERFALSFAYAALYYEPQSGNAFLVDEEGRSRPLSSEEIAEIRAFCGSFWQKNDFDVHAYDAESGLYEGCMAKSAAEHAGLAYRVNEAPDHPACKWTGEAWERLAMVVLDDGAVRDWPENICAQCVLGFTEAEKAQKVPARPGMYHIWDIASGAWKDPRSLEQAKRDAASSLRVDFELLRHAKSADGYFTPNYETETWTWQVMEARAYLADEGASTPYIDAFLAARTDEGKPGKRALCEDILANHKAFLATMAEVNGAQWAFLSRVKAAATKEECLAVQNEAHEHCMAARRSLEV